MQEISVNSKFCKIGITQNVISTFKKANNTNLEKYETICWPFPLYELLNKIILDQLTTKLDFHQTVEQARFGKHSSTIDHPHTMGTLIEKFTEYNVPLFLAFIDFEKAVDSIDIQAVLNSLKNARIYSRWTNVIKKR